MGWKAFSLNHFGRTMFHDLAGLRGDHHVAVVQGLDNSGEAAERLGEAEVHSHSEVASVPLENIVRFFFHLNDNVPGFTAGVLVTFSVKCKSVVASHAGIDMYLKTGLRYEHNYRL